MQVLQLKTFNFLYMLHDNVFFSLAILTMIAIWMNCSGIWPRHLMHHVHVSIQFTLVITLKSASKAAGLDFNLLLPSVGSCCRGDVGKWMHLHFFSLAWFNLINILRFLQFHFAVHPESVPFKFCLDKYFIVTFWTLGHHFDVFLNLFTCFDSRLLCIVPS